MKKHENERTRMEKELEVDIEIVTSDASDPEKNTVLTDARSRVSFGVYVDAQYPSAFQPVRIIQEVARDLILRTLEIRRIGKDKIPKMLVLCEGAIDIEHMLCGKHRYWKYDIVVQPVHVRSLADMCSEICIEYLLVQDPESNEPRFRYDDYETTVPLDTRDLLIRAWNDARERGMLAGTRPMKGQKPLLEARFTYDNPLEFRNYLKDSHPSELFILSRVKGVRECEFFLFSLSSRRVPPSRTCSSCSSSSSS